MYFYVNPNFFTIRAAAVNILVHVRMHTHANIYVIWLE